MDLPAHDFAPPTVIVLGNERRGLGRAYKAMCDARVRIPMCGAATSLNVSVAASIVLYEAARQRREGGSSVSKGPLRLQPEPRPVPVSSTGALRMSACARQSFHVRRNVLIAVLMAAAPVAAQQQPTPFAPPSLTAADYARAERFMPYSTAPLTLRAAVRPTFLPDDRFWYRNTTENGAEFVLVNPASRTRGACDLPACRDEPGADNPHDTSAGSPEVASPDGTRIAFTRGGNLWVRDASTGVETQLTTDRREGLRLRDQQRRLDEVGSPGSALVARLEEDRHVPARRPPRAARCTSSPRPSATPSWSRGSTRCRATAYLR